MAESDGVQGLVWRRLSSGPGASGGDLDGLRAAQRHHALHNALRERDIVQVVSALRAAGVEPILVKGWAVGRLYPEPGLRPYGDIDLLVRPAEMTAARDAIQACGEVRHAVDLRDSGRWDRRVEELHESSILVPLGETLIRIPCHEDHLRLICLHLLHHGAWKPLWLVDVAVALEARPADFDWARFLAGGARHTEWALCVLRLAHELLGAEVAGTPAEDGPRLPRWLIPSVLRAWERGSGSSLHLGLERGLGLVLNRPGALLRELRAHWRGPIEATVEMGAPFNNWPRLPLQLTATALRAPPLARRILSRAC